MDGMGLQDFPEFARSYGPTIRQQRADGPSQPHAVRRVTLPKPQGGERLLGIPTVTDRVSQQAMAHVLTPIGDPAFSAASCGVRPGRAAPGALRQVQGPIKAGDCLAVALDVAQCVDNVQHDVLMARVARRVRDKQVVGLIGRYVRAGVLVGESIQATERGTPQGGPLAPWLAHILLDALDRALERRGHRGVRYADDLLRRGKTTRAGKRRKDSVTRFLLRRLPLVGNASKSRVGKTNDGQCLGVTFRGTTLRWSDQAGKDGKHHARRLTGRSWGVSMASRRHKLAQYVPGWMGYFGISHAYRPIPALDPWRRRRVRLCDWKPWRKTRPKVRNLLALGTNKRQAIMTAISSKSSWHLSKTRATPPGMTKEGRRRQGLSNIRTLWMKAHGDA